MSNTDPLYKFRRALNKEFWETGSPDDPYQRLAWVVDLRRPKFYLNRVGSGYNLDVLYASWGGPYHSSKVQSFDDWTPLLVEILSGEDAGTKLERIEIEPLPAPPWTSTSVQGGDLEFYVDDHEGVMTLSAVFFGEYEWVAGFQYENWKHVLRDANAVNQKFSDRTLEMRGVSGRWKKVS